MNLKASTKQEYNRRIDVVLNYIEDHIDDDLSLEMLARLADFSPYHFHRVFRDMVGEPPKSYIRRLRLERAARYLKETNLSVTHIAFRSGFCTYKEGDTYYGYMNVKNDKNEPIQIDPEQARAVVRIFELYARGDQTFVSLKKVLRKEGFIYGATAPSFSRTSLSYILNNRFYLGELTWRGETHPGSHKPLVNRALFNACQDILKGRNRRTSTPNIPYSGGLFVCHYCGRAITGEQIRRKQADGTVRIHYYYKCPNTSNADHPPVRWKQDDLEAAIEAELGKLKMPDDELAGLFREAIIAALDDIDTIAKDKRKAITAQLAENKATQERLMNGYLNGAIPEDTFKTKTAELKDVRLNLEEECANVGRFNPTDNLTAMAAFDFCQRVRELWHGSNYLARREILDILSSNHALWSQTLYLSKRNPFDLLAEGPLLVDGRGTYQASQHRRQIRRHLKVPQKFPSEPVDMSPATIGVSPESFSVSPATFEAPEGASLVDAWASIFFRTPGLHVIRAAEMGRQCA